MRLLQYIFHIDVKLRLWVFYEPLNRRSWSFSNISWYCNILFEDDALSIKTVPKSVDFIIEKEDNTRKIMTYNYVLLHPRSFLISSQSWCIVASSLEDVRQLWNVNIQLSLHHCKVKLGVLSSGDEIRRDLRVMCQKKMRLVWDIVDIEGKLAGLSNKGFIKVLTDVAEVFEDDVWLQCRLHYCKTRCN